MSELNLVARRLAEIEERIANACQRARRPREAVRLVGASKGQPVERIGAAWQAGQVRFGENRVQEARAKVPLLPKTIEWHCLGPLQTNKVRQAVKLFRIFHAVDRIRIAEALDEEARRQGLVIEGFLEINLGGEPTKHGFPLDQLAEQIAPLAQLESLRVTGLMTIPPPAPDPESARPYFRELCELACSLNRRREWQGRLVELSMGMSDDFEVAIEEGATYVRLGTVLFGPRELSTLSTFPGWATAG